MDFEKYTDRAKGFLQSAQTMALRRGHQRLTPEHLLKVLLEDIEGLCANLIRTAGGDPKAALQGVDAELDRLPKVEGSGAGQVYMSPELARVFEQAEQLAQRAGDSFVRVEWLLLALAAAAGTGAAKALAAARVDAQSLNRAIEEVRNGRKADSAAAEEGYDALKKPTQPVLKIYGTRGSSACYNIRDFLHRSDVPFQWIDLTSDEQARAEARVSGLGDRRLPICEFPDGTRINRATVRQILEKLGWFRNPSREEYDLAIYGAGPAGLSAAVYGASEGLKTVVIERYAVGGQAASSPKIENYLGFPEGVSGAQLADRARQQACRFGAEILVNRAGVRGEIVAGKGIGYLDDGTKIVARACVCATGVDYRRLGLPNEDRFFGRGVYYGAGASEAMLCGRQQVYLVGGGNSAGQAALHFARYGARVSLVVRENSLKAYMSNYLIDRIQSEPKVNILFNHEVIALHGDQTLEAITLRNNTMGEERTVETGWLFLCLGGAPQTQWAAEAGVLCDSAGYILTGPDLLRDHQRPESWVLDRNPLDMETSLPGIFAAGDVRHGSIKRCASAVGEGARTIASVHRYLEMG